MNKFRHFFFAAISLCAILLLSGCDAVVLNPKGIIAVQEKHLLIEAVLLMLIVVIPVILLTPIICRRYRSSNDKAKYTPDWSHSVLLEIVWWAIPGALIVVLAIMTWVSTHKLDPYKPLQSDVKPITIQVVALQWRWLFIYPDQKIATINTLEFPVNTPVNFLITADAPMNSFQIPQLAGQIYAMAGMQTKLHIMANEIGDYNGRSVSFSGDGFANMMFVAKAVSNDDFNKWVASVKQAKNPLTIAAYNQIMLPTHETGIFTYSAVEPDLFNRIIMKFMHPDPQMPVTTQFVAPADAESTSTTTQSSTAPITTSEGK